MTKRSPKSDLFGTFWAPWGVFGPTLGTKWPHRDTTETVQAHSGASQPKKVPPGLPKWASAAVALTLWRLGKTAIRHLGDVFVWGIAHSGKAVSWQALNKVTKVTLFFTRRSLYT